MHVRRLLLIDDDPDFQRLLEERLTPSGFLIVLPPEPTNPLGHVKDIRPALIVIAVELPDKVGYALCNKAKKGLAREIPVILTTRSVPASGFRSHRKLKVHADEYIDKRAMTEEEVVEKVDRLVGLVGFAGSAPHNLDEVEVEELDMADLVEEPSLGSVDVGDDFDDGEDVSAVPRQIAHEGGVEFDPRELGADADDDGSFEFAEPMHVGDEVVVPMGGFREHRAPTERGDVPEAARSARPSQQGNIGQHDASPIAASTEADFAPDMSELGEFEADRTAVASPFPLGFDSPSARMEAAPVTATSMPALPPEPVPLAEHEDGEIEPSAPVADLDLGLEQVASLAEEEQSDVHERRHQLRAIELEKEVERLRTELDEARKQPPPGASPFSREREFLNLREVINKREKLILDLNDQIDARERQVLTEKDRLRELDRVRSDLDEKNLELEQSLLGANEELADLRSQRVSLGEQLRRQTDALASTRSDAEQLSHLLERERAEWQSERHSLVRQHASAMEQLRSDMETDRAAAEELLRDKQSSDLRTLKEAYEETTAEKDKGFGSALALAEVRRQEELTAAQRGAEERLQLELAEQRRRLQEELESRTRAHAAEVDSLKREHESQVETMVRQNREGRQALEERHTDHMTRMQDQHRQALEEVETRRAGEVLEADRRRVTEVAEADERRARDLAGAAEERARAEADLLQRFEATRGSLQREHAHERDTLEGRLTAHEKDLGVRVQEVRAREHDLAQAREALRAREEAIAQHLATIGERDGRIASLRGDLEELERQNTGYQEQVLRAFQRIRSDESTVARAKKAMAIALTLLDDAENAAESPRGDEQPG
ncbi:MAG TPA: response regulator [Kofleriaceae bacterium]|nr:response regulator [Kofleriaceae bacterium]